MLALTLVTMMLAPAPQAPQAMKAWVDQDGDPGRPESYVVSGLPELSRKAAWDSARARAREQRQERLAATGRRYLEQRAPAWLPAFVTERVLEEWCLEMGRQHQPAEVDREMIVRDHAFAKSYQGFLLLEDQAAPRAMSGSLGQRLNRATRGFLHRCGAIGALWGILALAAFWMDRLTRGYMTARLTLLALALGAAGPVLLMLL
jgi:hypothetical protein